MSLARMLSRFEVKLLSIVLDVSFATSTLLMPVMLLLIFRVRSIRKYRWYVLNSIFWDYLYDIALFIAKPVLFLPVLAAKTQVSLDEAAEKDLCASGWDFIGVRGIF